MGDLSSELRRPKCGESQVDEAGKEWVGEWKGGVCSRGSGESQTEQLEAKLEVEILRKLSAQTDELLEKLNAIVSEANEEKTKQQVVIKREKSRLEQLELKHRQTAQAVTESTGGSEEQRVLLSIRYREELDELELCRRTVDDLDFQLLETESRYEDQKETVHRQFMNDQLLLTDVYKRHQDVRKDRTNKELINTLRLEPRSPPTLLPPGVGLRPETIAEATKRLRLTFLDAQANDVIVDQQHLSWNRKQMTSSSQNDAHLDLDSTRSISATGSSEGGAEGEGGGGGGEGGRGDAGSPKEKRDASEGSNSSEQMSSVSSVSCENEDQLAGVLKQLETTQAERQRHEELEARLREELAKQSAEPGTVKLRQEKRQQARPLTRYLPVRNGEIDLPEFLEQCGHPFESCGHLTVSPHSVRGHLTKMGGRIKTWRRRWFVFDRTQRHLAYYVDRSERRRRGCIAFRDIEDVYVDFRRKCGSGSGGIVGGSPNPKLTFCVKTPRRTYRIVAPSSESRQIWIDVIFTGAEGYQEFV